MKKALLIFLLSTLIGTVTFAQQPATPAKTTAPAARTLTPAEQKQKDKIDREVQRERQIRAEWAQKQREYEAKQAEKERQKQAKKAEKERQQQEKESGKLSPAPVSAPPTPVAEPASPTSTPTPTVTEPTRKEKREKRKKEEAERPAPPVQEAPKEVTPAEPAPVSPAPVEKPKKAEKLPRPKREKKAVVQSVDSVAAPSIASEPSMSRPRREFLPKGHLFEPILLDPLEAQTYGSVLPAYYTDGEKYKGSIVPFAFGFAKAFYRRTPEPGRSSEWVLDLASFTQFEAYHDNKLNKARRQIMNNDYKISIIYNVRRGANNYRFRVYHISSHLGDDYIYRNNITAPTPNSVNYEQLDATYSRNVNNWRLYGGAGIVLRKSEERKLLSAQLGAFYKKPSDKAARLVGGADIKFWQQTGFRPGIHAGIGIELGRTQNNLTFLLEGYSGFRPYSQYENQQVNWVGIGLYLNPF
ncbi:DUF1207 domain-containing protein [Spirosoma agri]|uniref:DUF1207 domain-containing protein n=1 Tax=Spirosoma agri TaxID=1987381 RepID=A0A6M0IBD0_9BACT|nr:DUF1207 domain-containing protein [Spirosoma agri]NEU65394.1 DUF1207 domain-containing protein [Spirosoma agri]